MTTAWEDKGLGLYFPRAERPSLNDDNFVVASRQRRLVPSRVNNLLDLTFTAPKTLFHMATRRQVHGHVLYLGRGSSSVSRSPRRKRNASSSPTASKRKYPNGYTEHARENERSGSPARNNRRDDRTSSSRHDRTRDHSSVRRTGELEKSVEYIWDKPADMKLPKSRNRASEARSTRAYSEARSNRAYSEARSVRGEDPDRWPHDKYLENDCKGRGGPQHYRYRRQPEDDFMDQRRQERERIGLMGVAQLWSSSPPQFLVKCAREQKQRPILLILDGHTTHLDMNTAQFAWRNDITICPYHGCPAASRQDLFPVFEEFLGSGACLMTGTNILCQDSTWTNTRDTLNLNTSLIIQAEMFQQLKTWIYLWMFQVHHSTCQVFWHPVSLKGMMHLMIHHQLSQSQQELQLKLKRSTVPVKQRRKIDPGTKVITSEEYTNLQKEKAKVKGKVKKQIEENEEETNEDESPAPLDDSSLEDVDLLETQSDNYKDLDRPEDLKPDEEIEVMGLKSDGDKKSFIPKEEDVFVPNNDVGKLPVPRMCVTNWWAPQASVFMLPRTNTSGPTLKAVKQPQTINPPPPNFLVGTLHSGRSRSSGRRHTHAHPSDRNNVNLNSSLH
ncbi:hypothetical protein PR048_006558 [Dryococelus australis]|uniref:DDE-1 domain-containing protein n=1 Tax=Dryococelus australis TaxID=614101 RepID=A0ABQ9IBA9_9NEOP|nr:hypothetical protein PR048_006558 [Dryococelus australis]